MCLFFFIIFLQDLPAKVAEDFAAMGACKNRGFLGGLALKARRVSPRRVAVNEILQYLDLPREALLVFAVLE
jgi:hypothetical protein